MERTLAFLPKPRRALLNNQEVEVIGMIYMPDDGHNWIVIKDDGSQDFVSFNELKFVKGVG
jgi:hypothetical protein